MHELKEKRRDEIDYKFADLEMTKQNVYNLCNLKITHFHQEMESQDYGACRFDLEERSIIFRVAKITPKKIGQFVTCWKRKNNGQIEPFDNSDRFHFLVISVRNGEDFGQFIFPKKILLQRGIISNLGKGGKRGIRIYPPWDSVISLQAKKTQAWQLSYFLDIPANGKIDELNIKILYSLLDNENMKIL